MKREDVQEAKVKQRPEIEVDANMCPNCDADIEEISEDEHGPEFIGDTVRKFRCSNLHCGIRIRVRPITVQGHGSVGVNRESAQAFRVQVKWFKRKKEQESDNGITASSQPLQLVSSKRVV